jgi:hypothetical protein
VAAFWYLLLSLHFHITYIHSLNGTHIFEIRLLWAGGLMLLMGLLKIGGRNLVRE